MRRTFGFVYKTVLYSIAVIFVLFALFISALRYLLPQLPDVTDQLENFLTNRYAIEVTLAQISADWGRNGPELVLHNLSIIPASDKATRVTIGEARVLLNFWESARTAAIQYDRVQLDNMRLHYDLRDTYRDGDTATSAVKLPDNLTNLLLNQLDHIEVTDSTIELVNLLGIQRAITIRELRWLNRGAQHQGVGKLAFSKLSDNTLDVIIDANGRSAAALTGQVYVNANKLDITPWVQQQAIDTEIKKAEFNYQLWLNFAQNQFSDGLLQLGEQVLVWQVGTKAHQLRIPHGELKLRPFAENGWRVNSNPMTIAHNETSWVLPTFSWEQTPRSTAMSLVDVPLAPMLELLNILGSRGAAVSDELANRAAQGTIDMAFRSDLEQPLRWYARGEGLSWGQIGGVPGLSNVNLSLSGIDQQVEWQLTGQNAEFLSQALDYDEPWALTKLDLRGRFEWLDKAQWQLNVNPGSQLHLADMPMVVQAKLTPTADSIYIDALAQTTNAEPIDAEVLRRYLPVTMGDDLHDYLTVALQGGQAHELAMVWRGAMDDFPYHEKRGLFEARARLDGLNYKFQPNWRPIFDAHAVVNFTNERMHIVATDGVLGNIAAQRVDVVIPDILAGDDAYLDIRAEIAGNATELQPIFADSPLADSLGTTFSELQLNGPMTSELQLTIPLHDNPDVIAEGYAELNNVSLFIDSLGETFTDVQGRVLFRNDVISSDALQLKWHDLPLQVNLDTQQRQQDFFVDVRASGEWQLDQFAPLTAGKMPWQAEFNLSLPNSGGYSFHWHQTADLSQVQVNAPPPLTQQAGTENTATLMVSGSQDSILVNAELDDTLLLELQLDGQGQTLQTGYARIGREFSQQPSPNVVRLNPRFMLDVQVPEIDVEAWQQSFHELQKLVPSGVGESHLAALLQPDFIQLSSPKVYFDDIAMTNVTSVMWPSADGWQARFEAKEALADITWQRVDDGSNVLKIAADYLEVMHADTELTEQDSANATAILKAPDNFTGLPDIALECKRCRLNAYELGEVSLYLTATDDTLTLQRFNAQHRNHTINASGSWALETDSQHPQTTFTGTFTSPDFGEFLENYDLTSMVRDSSATIDFDLRYLAAPYQFDEATLSGSVKWRLGQGYLNEVSDRGARLFSLLSLGGILRKLQFDFRDVFANGLFYTSFGGDFTIENGTVYTENTVLNGAAGDMEVKGSTNLVTRELDYDLQFVPKVTSSLPVILAWMINPPSGLAALVIDRMLHDAKVISRLEYSISGTMDEPVIKEVARDSRDAPIPPEVRNNDSSTNGAADDQQPEPAGQPEDH